MNMMELKKWEHLIEFRFFRRTPYQEYESNFEENHSISKQKYIKWLCDRYYASIQEYDAHYLDGSENQIVPALAGKPYGISPWEDLEKEMLRYIRPSTFSQKIRSLGWIGIVFKINIKKGGDSL
jgi:hypothetical protein